jgi:TldD protein
LKYKQKSTGNGRRESFRFKPIPRMSNTMILPGQDDPKKIVASVDDGILVVKMGGGQVDTVRGDFVFEISEGYLIEKGSIGPMIKNATMMGNGLKVLREIDMVGSDTGFGIGTCGKDGQGVPIADAQPTLRMPEIVVGGRGQ